MEWEFIRRIIALGFCIAIVFMTGLGFCYTNEYNNEYAENSVYFSDNWIVDDSIVFMPYDNQDGFTIENILPEVYGDQILVMRCYYTDFIVYVDGQKIIESKDYNLFGHSTDVGKKEIWIPLKHEYSYKIISVTMNLQEGLYNSELTEAFITTRSGYVVRQMEQHALSIVMFVVFTVTGIFEMIISVYFILRRSNIIRKLTFEALFYAGAFSVITGQWIINDTRVPFILCGHMTGFSILNLVAFLLMPLSFFELSRAINLRISKMDNILDGLLAMTVMISLLLCSTGVMDWSVLLYIAHVLDVAVIITVAYYSYMGLKEEQKKSDRGYIALANGIFILLALIALIRYIDNNSSNYTLIVIIDFMIYIMAQVGLIYRRIGLKVHEEEEFAAAKVAAYTDELTGLANRRVFYSVIDDFEKHKYPKDLTIISLDVNRLKYYNDNMGHEAGDELLVGAAECMRKAFSSSSTAVICRMGGDEFFITLLSSYI